MSEPVPPEPPEAMTAKNRQRRLNKAAQGAPFMDDLDRELNPRTPTREVFADGEVPGVSAFPWTQRPAEGWPEGYNPFAPPQKFESLPEELDEPVEPDWEAVEVEVRERGYEEGYTAGHKVGEEQGLVAGHAEGFAQGRQEGHDEGFARGVAEAQSTFDTIGDAVQDLRAVGAELESRYVRSVVELATRIADKVVGVRLAQAPELLTAQVGAAIRRFRGAESCVVQVHPEDVPLLEAATELRRAADGVIEVKIEGTAGIQRGGWRVATELGGVDGTLEERLAAIVESVRSVDARWDEPSAAAVVAAARQQAALQTPQGSDPGSQPSGSVGEGEGFDAEVD